MKNAKKIGRVARVSKGSIFPRSQDQVHKKNNDKCKIRREATELEEKNCPKINMKPFGR